MSHDQMREYLMETTKHVKFFAEYTIDQQLKSNPVKDWMHHCLVFELNTSAQIGFKKFAPQGSSTHYAKTNEWLYASYCEFCMNSNNNIINYITTSVKSNFAKELRNCLYFIFFKSEHILIQV